MPAPIDPKVKEQIRRVYVSTSMSDREIGDKFGVSDRSIANWAKDGGWDAARKAEKVLSENVVQFSGRTRERLSIRDAAQSNDPITIANDVIADLQGEMRAGMPGKDKAAVANALKGWVEYREKLQPPTVADLAARAIELNIRPEEFLSELKKAWAARA
jgi:hypothetical protein